MKKTNLLTVILAAFLIIYISPDTGIAYSGGSGTEAAPYQIANAADLLQLSTDTGNYNKYFILTADIDLSSSGTFTAAVIAPYGVGSFSGHFNGAGHKISNMTINTGAAAYYVGLFGYVYGGEIKNISLSNANITCGNNTSYVGGLIGTGNTTISNCSITGNIIAGNDSSCIGGLAGYCSNSTITNCDSSDGAVTGGSSVGGLIGSGNNIAISSSSSSFNVTGKSQIGGFIGSCSTSNISGCNSTGTVSSADNTYYVGGLVGYNYGNISDCFSTGAVSGGSNSYYIGGLAGYNYGSIINCNSTGAAGAGTGSQQIGGLAGYNGSNGNIRNCSSTGAVTGQSYLGGLTGYNQGSIINCYSKGSVTGTSYLGGLAGNNNYDGSISNCYSTGSVTGTSQRGGFIGYNSGSISNCFFLVTSGPDNGDEVPLTEAQNEAAEQFLGLGFPGRVSGRHV